MFLKNGPAVLSTSLSQNHSTGNRRAEKNWVILVFSCCFCNQSKTNLISVLLLSNFCYYQQDIKLPQITIMLLVKWHSWFIHVRCQPCDLLDVIGQIARTINILIGWSSLHVTSLSFITGRGQTSCDEWTKIQKERNSATKEWFTSLIKFRHQTY